MKMNTNRMKLGWAALCVLGCVSLASQEVRAQGGAQGRQISVTGTVESKMSPDQIVSIASPLSYLHSIELNWCY